MRTMKHCLYIPELYSMVLEDVESFQDILALALTCKTLRDPALQILWEYLDTIAPLIRCLPDDIWSEAAPTLYLRGPGDTEGQIMSRLVLERDIDATTDVSRFEFYAQFIRSLEFRWDLKAHDTCLVDMAILKALASSTYLKHPILPRLKVLVWGSIELPLDPRVIAQFFGSRLTGLTVSFPRTMPVYLSVGWDLWTQRLRNLRTLTLRGGGDAQRHNLKQVVSDLVCSLQDVDEFTTDIPLHHQALVHLARSSCSYIEIPNDVSEILKCIANAVPPPSPPFPKLRYMRFTAHKLNDFVALIPLLCAENLKEIFITYPANHTRLENHDLTQLYKTIGERCSPTTLERVLIDDMCMDTVGTSVTNRIGSLAPLFKFNLRILEASCPFGFDLDDKDIETLAKAWPRLKYLALMNFGATGDVRVTMAGLVSLVQRCPELVQLDLWVHVTAVDLSALIPTDKGFIPNEHVTFISVHTSEADEAVQAADVAAFLSTLFPKLFTIFGEYSKPNEDGNFWEEVQALLPLRLDVGSDYGSDLD